MRYFLVSKASKVVSRKSKGKAVVSGVLTGHHTIHNREAKPIPVIFWYSVCIINGRKYDFESSANAVYLLSTDILYIRYTIAVRLVHKFFVESRKEVFKWASEQVCK